MSDTVQPKDQVQTSEDLQAASTRCRQSEHELRAIMKSGDVGAMGGNTKVFYQKGKFAWTVKAEYWRVALASDDEGNRYLTESELDRVLPRWRSILRRERSEDQRWPVPAQAFMDWLDAELLKARRFGKPWCPPSPVKAPASPPITVPSEGRRSAVMSSPCPDGHTEQARTRSLATYRSHQAMVTRALRSIVTELKGFKEVLPLLKGGSAPPTAPTPPGTDVGTPLEQDSGPSHPAHNGVLRDGHANNPRVQAAQAAQPYPPGNQPLPQVSAANLPTMPDDTVPPAYLRPRSDAHAGRVPQATVSLAREVTNSLRVLRTELKELSEVFANALQHNLFQQMAPTPPPPAITIDITLEQIYGTDFLDYYGIPRNAQLLHPIAQAGLRNAN